MRNKSKSPYFYVTVFYDEYGSQAFDGILKVRKHPEYANGKFVPQWFDSLAQAKSDYPDDWSVQMVFEELQRKGWKFELINSFSVSY